MGKLLRDLPNSPGDRQPGGNHLVPAGFLQGPRIDAYRDEAYNVIARVPATPGYEDASPVILHSHSDMVCIKDEGVDHDFAKDPIRVYAEGDVVTAEGTTLGGDDGIGVAL